MQARERVRLASPRRRKRGISDQTADSDDHVSLVRSKGVAR